jgi:ABC-2 type transport system ATP-binding protein
MQSKKEVKVDADTDVSKALKKAISPKNQPLIMIKNISKSYRKKLVLKDLDFEVFPGDIFGVVGMSGSGKTTLFQLMSGMITIQAGDVLVRRDALAPPPRSAQPDYVSVFRNHSLIKKNFGFASQFPSFYEHLTAEENLLMYAALYGLSKKKAKENTNRLLKLVNLESERDTVAAELSGGMQRRLDIACSLVHDPKVLFLDEPTSDLDPVMRKQVWALIQEIQSKGTTIVLASHILEEVENLCTKVAILQDKKIVGYGTLKELKSIFKRPKQIRIELEQGKYEPIIKKLRKEKAIAKIIKKDNMLVIFARPDDRLTRKIIKAVESSKDKLVSFEVADASLTEIFETVTKKLK